MKNKLTVAIERDLIPKAKAYAKEHGTSLSEIIEKTFRKLPTGKEISFSRRWRGKFTAACKKEDRYKKLAEKYL